MTPSTPLSKHQLDIDMVTLLGELLVHLVDLFDIVERYGAVRGAVENVLGSVLVLLD